MDQSSAARLSVPQMRRAVLAVTIGNGLEFYDFVTFAYFAIQIGNTFFPSNNHFLSLMGSLAVFGIGFITRPIGAAVLGTYADRVGRKPAMLFSMTLMGCGILLLALTPGYARIGIAAPLLALTARLMQGFALGGEIGTATSYMMESARPERRGLTISWQGVSQQIAATVGALVGLMLSLMMGKMALDAYGWRLALGLGAAIVPFALVLRRNLPETHDRAKIAALPRVAFKSYRRVIALGFVFIASGTIATYVMHYMATYGQNSIHLSASTAFAGELANDGVGIAVALTSGWLSDHIGRRPVIIGGQIAFLFGILPCFAWMISMPGATSFIGANLILSVLASSSTVPVFATITESLPPAVRARAFALVYSVPVAVFGGSTQFFVTWLLHVSGSPMALGWYLTAVTLVGTTAAFFFRESAPARLRATATSAAPA